MSESGLGPEVKQIIAANLATMDHVEVLLLLHKAAPRSLSGDDLARETQRPLNLVMRALADLTGGGLVSRTAGPVGVESFSYDPRSEALRSAVEEVADVYVPFSFSAHIDGRRFACSCGAASALRDSSSTTSFSSST